MLKRTFGEGVYNSLPLLLKECVSTLQTQEEKDMFLLGVIVALSSTMPNAYTIHRDHVIYPMLYGFVIAPPASNKGVVRYAEQLVRKVHRGLKSQGKGLIIGGNSSAAGMARVLKVNNGRILILETESDVISNVFKQDWGSDLSMLLRKAFHHESIQIERKKEEESFAIDRPQIAMMLTGTPNQLPMLMRSVEDGLLSRFTFYIIEEGIDIEWQDTDEDKSSPNINPREVFENASTLYFEYWSKHLQQNFVFIRTPEQKESFNAMFKPMFDRAKGYKDSHIESLVKRHLVMAKRITMVLSMLRYMESNFMEQIQDEIILPFDNIDVEVALKITEVCYQHAEQVYDMLCSTRTNDTFDNIGIWEKALKVYDCIPIGKTVTREQIIESVRNKFGKQKGFGIRSIDGRLRLLKKQGMFDNSYPEGIYFICEKQSQNEATDPSPEVV
ncbi:MAG: hypothetical protein JWM14_3258 [Chitinophagaceae bacterium]|nr:hypothetical protein [Chitinophagaceae bacterium]